VAVETIAAATFPLERRHYERTIMSMKYIGLDFETYCDVNLPVHGLDRYVHDPSFRVLIASIKLPDGRKKTYDFIYNGKAAMKELKTMLWSHYDQGEAVFAAHNVGFERAVLDVAFGFEDDFLKRMVDSAVIASCQGAARSLETSAAQLTGVHKLETGRDLIMLFSVPNEANGFKCPDIDFIESSPELRAKWQQFKDYCEVDAEASASIALKFPLETWSTEQEQRYEWLTREMNVNGWHVDMELVNEMQLRYEENAERARIQFEGSVDSGLNLNSNAQLKKWCEARGVRMSSFDQDHVDQYVGKIERALVKLSPTDPKRTGYMEVHAMLTTKQVIGGSSLSKLQKIIDLVGVDGRLRDQYMHAGAGQTYRTSARGVQLQNLKRLGPLKLDDMGVVFDHTKSLSNDVLAENLRQVFTAEDPDGFLFVGDFGSVESRGLAYLAGEEWKLDAYRQGKDIYKVLASRFSGVPYDDITKEARMEGKYSELSCGYQAGGQAVKDFMHRLGFEVDLPGAEERVAQWRDANPKIVDLWQKLDDTLHEFVATGVTVAIPLAHDLWFKLTSIDTPESLQAQHPGAQSMLMVLEHRSARAGASVVLERVFHGVYARGRNIAYYKPSTLKGGDLWKGSYMHPKTKKTTFYTIYGGKLSGILTQSLCRELFFQSLLQLYNTLKHADNVMIIGQFHDEIVVEWKPFTPGAGGSYGCLTEQDVRSAMQRAMTSVSWQFKEFPLTAEINKDYRYTK